MDVIFSFLEQTDRPMEFNSIGVTKDESRKTNARRFARAEVTDNNTTWLGMQNCLGESKSNLVNDVYRRLSCFYAVSWNENMARRHFPLASPIASSEHPWAHT